LLPENAPRHYPPRHNGFCNFTFCDGHVAGLMFTDLTKNLFYSYPVAPD
jgi:prepilin-type processing-associated H-X9-DG protein